MNEKKSFADKIIAFNKQLDFQGKLPLGINIMNPFKENKCVIPVSSAFYKKYYDDTDNRYFILGINPGRFGGGITGVPFTDPKRLTEKCGIDFPAALKHEPSSVFVYEVIDAFGGPAAFYKQFYINSICPLGFTINKNGKNINYNYYDDKKLADIMHTFITESIQKQIAAGNNTDVAFCFGTGKNEFFLRRLNGQKKFFKKIIALEHPRFIIQYKSKSRQLYIDKYLTAFREIT